LGTALVLGAAGETSKPPQAIERAAAAIDSGAAARVLETLGEPRADRQERSATSSASALDGPEGARPGTGRVTGERSPGTGRAGGSAAKDGQWHGPKMSED
jgi:hypothetical protein